MRLDNICYKNYILTRKGIVYSSPKVRISSYQALNEEQLLEVNKVYAKLAVLENRDILKHVIPHSSNSKLRETIGNAFSSTELIHYGEVKQNEIIEIPKEVVDLFALIQQIDGIDKNKVEEIKKALLVAIQNGEDIGKVPEITTKMKESISIEEMYQLTGGTVEYGKANSIVKNMFYLSKARQNAIKLSETLRQVLENDSRFDEIIEYIKENGFRIEPEIISRQSGKGVKLSESVNLNLTKDEIIAEVFTNITFETYSGLIAKRGQEIIEDQYGMILLDELHRTGAKEWEGKIDALLESQNENVKVLGITATPVRDVDGRDMSEETAKKLGYTDEEVKQRNHFASNMTLENAIRMGYVVNPKLVYCKYDLISSGKMDELKAKIDDIEDEAKRTEEKKILEEYAGQSLENVPEEYIEKIAKLRTYGLGTKPSKLRQAKKQRDNAKSKNNQAKELEKKYQNN